MQEEYLGLAMSVLAVTLYHVCVCVCVCVCVRVCVCVCVPVRLSVCTHTHMRSHTHIFTITWCCLICMMVVGCSKCGERLGP